MKAFIKIVFIIVTLSFTVLQASEEDSHANHSHEKNAHCEHDTGMKSESIQVIAKNEVQRLVTEKKIAKSWKSIPIAKIGKTHQSYQDDWIVVFENPKIKKKSRQTLYIFISKVGNITGANYTGK